MAVFYEDFLKKHPSLRFPVDWGVRLATVEVTLLFFQAVAS